MRIGDLVKLKGFDQYGVIENVLCFKVHNKQYAVVYWQCGNRSGQYTSALELMS